MNTDPSLDYLNVKLKWKTIIYLLASSIITTELLLSDPALLRQKEKTSFPPTKHTDCIAQSEMSVDNLCPTTGLGLLSLSTKHQSWLNFV